MVEAVLSWFFKKGQGAKSPLPPLPRGRTVVLGETDDSIQSVAAFHAEGLGRAIFISYRDAKGQLSDRRVSIINITETSVGDRLLSAFCHERRARRAFRIDRIIEAIDLATGEVFAGQGLVEGLGALMVNEETPEAAVFHRCRHEITILAFLAKCDGYYHPAEEEVILHHILGACFDLDIDGDLVLSKIRGLYPDVSQYFDALRALATSKDEEIITRVVRSAIQLVAADGEISPEEHALVSDLEDFLKEANC